MSKNRDQKHSKQKHEREVHHQEVVEQEASASERVLVEAPKGSSRLRFMLNLGLVIFLLLIFSITGPMMSALTGDGQGSVDDYVSWRLPGGEVQSMNIRDFYAEKRKLQWIEDFFGFLRLPPGTKPENDENVARFLVMEELAKQAGVSVAASEMSETVLNIFGTSENYRGHVARVGRGVTMPQFEAVLKRGLAYRRYRSLLLSGVAEADPEEAVTQWKELNQDYDFQYVALESADFLEEAKAEIPDVEVLQDWFDALPAYQKTEFNTEESWSADLVYFDPAAETVPQALLDRFPPPEGQDPEEVAKTYYNTHHFIRYVRPEEENDEDGTEEETDATEETGADPEEDSAEVDEEPEAPQYYSFEEVAEAARREAPLYHAMVAWLNDVNQRIAAEEVFDMQTEAISLGLSFEQVDPRTATGWEEGEEPWAGRYLSGRMRGAPEGGFAPGVAVEEGAFVVAKIVEKRPPTLPPFEEIREKVGDKWAEEHSTEIARERLEAIRESLVEMVDETEGDGTDDDGGEGETEDGTEDGTDETPEETPEEEEEDVPPTVDFETFRTAVEAAGFEMVERGFAPRYPGASYDYTAETPEDRYLRTSSALYQLEEGQVAEAATTPDLKHAFLVRYGGQRDPSIDRMGPYDLTNQSAQLASTAAQDFFNTTYDDPAWFAEKYLLNFKKPAAEEGGPVEPTAPGGSEGPAEE